jgi:hypothetical protein
MLPTKNSAGRGTKATKRRLLSQKAQIPVKKKKMLLIEHMV